MKTSSKRWSCWGLLAAMVGLAGCGAGAGVGAKSAPPASPQAYYGQRSFEPTTTRSGAPAAAGASRESAPSPRAMETDEAAAAPSAAERPGLGTEWGETRYSHVSNVSFDRADWSHPAGVLSLYYNDR